MLSLLRVEKYYASGSSKANTIVLERDRLSPAPRAHPEGAGGVVDGGAHEPGVEELEPRRPRSCPLHDDHNLGDVLVISKVLDQVKWLPTVDILAFPSLRPRGSRSSAHDAGTWFAQYCFQTRGDCCG